MKRIISLLLTAVIALSMTAFAENADVEISFRVGDSALSINGSVVEVETPYVVGIGTTLVPVRVISEAFGANVDWIEATETVTIDYEETNIILQIGNPIATVNGIELELLEAPQLTESGYTMVPLRFISENLGAEVGYDEATEAITVSKKAAAEPVPTAPAYPWLSPSVEKLSDDDIASVKAAYYGIRYDFEQGVLPDMIFNDEFDESERDINDQEGFSDFIKSAWHYTAETTILTTMIHSDEEYAIEKDEDIYLFFDNAIIDCGLTADENITAINYADGNNGDKIAIITLKEYNYPLISKYIGIKYSETDGFSVYTLEKSMNDLYAFCEITDKIRGTIDFIDSDYNSFLEAVKQGGKVSASQSRK